MPAHLLLPVLFAVLCAACGADAGDAARSAAGADSSRQGARADMSPRTGVDTAPLSPQRTLLIDRGGIGPIRLGETLEWSRQGSGRATFTRTSDGDGVALVDVTFGPDTTLVVYAGEDDADMAIDWTKRVEQVEAFSAAFHTAEGVRPGMPVRDVARVFGTVVRITVSEIESRQYVEFERQPAWLTFRLDYTGVFDEGSRTTTRHAPDAKILSIAVAPR